MDISIVSGLPEVLGVPGLLRVPRVLRILGVPGLLGPVNLHSHDLYLVYVFGNSSVFNGNVGAAEQKFSINFSKAMTKFCLSLHYNHDSSYLFVNG